MALEVKDLLHELDLPAELADKEIADVKTAFHETFVSRKLAGTDPDIVKTIYGKRLGEIETVAAREFGLSKQEIEGKKIEDIISLGTSKFKTNIEELKTAQPTDTKEWETKLEKERKEALKFKEMAELKGKEVEELTNKYTGEIKSIRLNHDLTKIESSIPISKDAKPLEIQGFKSVIKEKYRFDYDDTGALVALDSKGEKIQNEKKTGFMSVEDVYKLEAKENGILQVVGTAPAKKTEPPKFVETQSTGRELPKSYLKNREKYGK